MAHDAQQLVFAALVVAVAAWRGSGQGGYLFKMEEALGKYEWLAGDTFSLADIALAPYVNRLDMLSMSGMWTEGRLPRVEAWFDRIKAMKSFAPTFLEWCPEELTNDLRTFGAQSWPDVKRIIGMD